MESTLRKPTILGPTLLKGGLFASLVLLAAACSSESVATKPASDGSPNGIVAGTLETSSATGTVTLRNTTDLPILYLLVDKDQAVAAIYPVCAVAHCTNLTQGSSATVSYSQIPGYTSKSTEAIVYWMRYSVRADGTRVISGREEITNIKLK